MRGFDYKIIILAVLTCIIYVLYRRVNSMENELNKIENVVNIQNQILNSLGHNSDTNIKDEPLTNLEEMIDITHEQLPSEFQQLDMNLYASNIIQENLPAEQLISSVVLPNSSCELETNSELEETVSELEKSLSYSNTSHELAIYSNDNEDETTSIISSIDNNLKKKSSLVKFEGDNIGINIPTVLEKDVEQLTNVTDKIYNLEYDIQKIEPNCHKIESDTESESESELKELNLKQNVNIEKTEVIKENTDLITTGEDVVAVDQVKNHYKKKVTVPILLRNKLAELQDMAENLNISIIKKVNGNSKRKTKLELANDILEKKISN